MWITEKTRPTATSPPPLPDHPNGGHWHLFVQRNWNLYWADTWADVLDALVHGGVAAEGSAALEASPEWAADVAYFLDSVVTTTQAEINQEARYNGESVSEEEWFVLSSPKFPHPEIERWVSPVPLVLLSQEYEPYSNVPRPEGNILWVESLRTSDLEGVVTSLEDIGYLTTEDISALAEGPKSTTHG